MGSVRANQENLQNLIFTENPNIILLNETWLKQSKTFSLHSYLIIRQDRDDGYSGVATCIRKNIVFKIIKTFLSESIQYIVIKVGDILIKNIYVNRESTVDDNLLYNELYNHDETQNSV